MERDAAWLLKEKYGGIESAAYFDDLRELERGVPLAYLIGHVPFLGTKIYLDSHPLIPRAETEYWVEKAIDTLKEPPSMSRPGLDIEGVKFLDLCAGSGAIGVALLKAFPHSHVDFAEIDPGHHETIWKNIAENNIADERATVFGGDLFEEIRDEYDAIFSNPPYIDPAKQNRIAESVLLHEPHEALFGGTSGMEIIERILREAKAHLKPSGTLYIEHEPEQTPLIAALGNECGYENITVHRDQYDVERMTSLRTP